MAELSSTRCAYQIWRGQPRLALFDAHLLIDPLAYIFNLLLDPFQGLRVWALTIGLEKLNVASIEDLDGILLLVLISCLVCMGTLSVGYHLVTF